MFRLFTPNTKNTNIMKSKFESSELSGLDFKVYRNKLYKELARMKSEHPDASNPTQFLLVSEYEFSDMPGKRLPLLIVGKLEGEWKKFFKTEIKVRKQKDFALGKCSFGEAGAFNLEINAGRITGTWTNMLDKLIFNPAKLSANVVEKLVAGGEDADLDAAEDSSAGVAGAVVAGAASAAAGGKETEDAEKQAKKPAKTKEEKVAAVKEQTKAEVTGLSDKLGQFKTLYATLQKEVVPKLKSGEAGRNELKQVQTVSELCESFLTEYDKSNKITQKEFAKGKQEIVNASKEVKKLAAVTKENKKSLAQLLADKFFNKNAKRPANDKEIALMNTSLQTVIAARGINALKDAEREIALKSIYATAVLRGPKFTAEQTLMVASKLG
jgi:hypothetical protein